MMETVLGFLLVALAFSLLLMAALWRLALYLKKASIVDPAWSGLITFQALLYVTLGEGLDWRRLLAALMAVAWGTRLTYFLLFKRIVGKGEDPRYAELLAKWGEDKDEKLLRFFLLQGLVAVVFSLPFLIVSLNPAPGPTALEWFAFFLWMAAFAGEVTADVQLDLFKSDPANRGKTCRSGLWGYSRHPNYFFEFMIWCAVFLFALSSPYGFLAVICPALMFYFLYRVTGIPKTEEQALKTRGDDYRDYQKTTSRFIPWPRRK